MFNNKTFEYLSALYETGHDKITSKCSRIYQSAQVSVDFEIAMCLQPLKISRMLSLLCISTVVSLLETVTENLNLVMKNQKAR